MHYKGAMPQDCAAYKGYATIVPAMQAMQRTCKDCANYAGYASYVPTTQAAKAIEGAGEG